MNCASRSARSTAQPSRAIPIHAIGASALGDAGTMARPDLGFAASLAWTPARFRVELSGSYWLSQTITLAAPPPNPPRGGRLDLATVGLLGCYALVTSPVELSPCAGAEIGPYRGSAFGVSETGSGSIVWSAFRVGGLAGLPIWGPLALRATLEGLAPLTRPTFQIGGVGQVHRPAPISGRAGIGAELRF